MAKILCVEDMPAIAALVCDELTERGHQVVVARNPTAALEAALAQIPEIILLDITLGPERDEGWTVLARLKSVPTTSSIPVITLTARPDEGWRQRSVDGGAFAHLTKPVNFDELAETIVLALAQEKRRD
jgi:CheY-like chemotaxis protein